MVKLSTSNPRYEDVPLNIPPFQWSSDLSYWDESMGAVSDNSRQTMWLAMAILSTIVTIIIGFVMTSILVKPKVRRRPYNLFLIFLMMPDLIFNACQPPINILSYVAGKYVSVGACKFQAFIFGFGICANCHVNALIALELHRMLCDSHECKRYFPPSAFHVAARCLASYVAVALVVLVWALNFENLPMRVFMVGGCIFCGPAPFDTGSALVFYLVLFPFGMAIPFGICGYVALDVLKRRLLPRKGEGKRILAIFFCRLFVVFLVFWTPVLLSIFVPTNPWFTIALACWSLFQGAVSAIAMLSKGDIRDCFMDLLAKVSCGLYSFCKKSIVGPNMTTESNVAKSSICFDDFSQGEVGEPANPYLQDEGNHSAENISPTIFYNEPIQGSRDSQ